MKRIIIFLISILLLATPVNVKASDLDEELQCDEWELLALIVSAEAENQGFIGKCLVADTILNRVDDERFPDTITEVVSQPGQYSVFGSGSYLKANPSYQTYLACRTQLFTKRVNDTVLYFRSSSDWNWEFKEGDHYFK